MPRLILILTFLISNFGFSQNLSSLIPDKKINEFIEWKLKTNSKKNKIYYKIEQWTDLSFNYIDDLENRNIDYDRQFLFTKENNLDTIFSKADKDFLIKQKNSITQTE